MQIQSYLFFDGRAEEALAFYRKAIGAEQTMLMRFKESPDTPPPGMVPPGSENKVMHMSFRVGDTEIMGSDGQCQGKPNFQGFSLSLAVADEADARRKFAALGEGGQVQMPLGKTFFSPCFGMVADRFGVSWMVIVPPDGAAA
jgi:PhnB protein